MVYKSTYVKRWESNPEREAEEKSNMLGAYCSEAREGSLSTGACRCEAYASHRLHQICDYVTMNSEQLTMNNEQNVKESIMCHIFVLFNVKCSFFIEVYI